MWLLIHARIKVNKLVKGSSGIFTVYRKNYGWPFFVYYGQANFDFTRQGDLIGIVIFMSQCEYS